MLVNASNSSLPPVFGFGLGQWDASECDQAEAWKLFARSGMLALAALPWPGEHAQADLLEDENYGTAVSEPNPPG